LSGARTLSADLGQWRTHGGALSESLAAALRQGVLDGRIPVGAPLPSEREIARHLEVSRGTVVSALATLREEGWVSTRHGSGSIVGLPARLTERTAPLSMDYGGDGVLLDMRAAVTAAPHHDYLAALRRATERCATTLLDDGHAPAGLARLREAIAARYTATGLPTRPDQILISSGARAAMSLLIDQFHDRRRPVLVENPSYPAVLALLRRHNARLATVPVTGQGWDADRLSDVVRSRRPGMAYVMPDFHNPTGMVMPAGLRADLAAIADRENMIVIVDETMRDLDLRDPPPHTPYLAGRNVIHVGSTSKTYWGGLRVGWIRSSAARVRELLLNPLTPLTTPPPLEQLITEELLREEHRVLPPRRAQLRAQRDHLVELLARSDHWSFQQPAGGLTVWLRLHQLTGQALADRSGDQGLLVAPGPWFAADRTLVHYLRLPFTAAPRALTTAVEILTAAASQAGAPRPANSRGSQHR
jgi:DNA-binding transcriptional MocR family regulator